MRGLGEKMVFDWVRWILAQKVSTLEPAEKLVRAWELGCGVRLDAAEVLELLQDGHISAAAKLSAEASAIAALDEVEIPSAEEANSNLLAAGLNPSEIGKSLYERLKAASSHSPR